MSILTNPTWRLVGPIFLRVDWRHRYWFATRKAAYNWLVLAVLSDLLAKSIAGKWDWLSLVLAFVTPLLLSRLPPRFGAAAGGLLVTQALASVGIALGLFMLGVPYGWREAVLSVWAIWCAFALLYLALTYLRTPRREMPDA